MRALVERQGGIVTIAPSMREVPLADNPEAFAFGERLFGGTIDIVILLTGVGTRALAEVLESKYSRDAFLAAVKDAAPSAWVRQGGRNGSLARRLSAPKALLLDALSAQFRRRATRAGLAFNPGFAGAYDFSRQPDFGGLMQQFLDGLPEHGLIMCHPGFVDEILVSLDPLTVQREREHAFLGSGDFPRLLAANNVTLD